MKPLHQMLKKEWKNGLATETTVTDSACPLGRGGDISVLINKCTFPYSKKHCQLKENLLEQPLFSVVFGENFCLPNSKVWEKQERKEGALILDSTCLPTGWVLGCGHQEHLLLCKRMTPHSLQIAALWLRSAAVRTALRPRGSGSTCPHKGGPLAPQASRIGPTYTLCSNWINHEPQLPWMSKPLSQHTSSS